MPLVRVKGLLRAMGAPSCALHIRFLSDSAGVRPLALNEMKGSALVKTQWMATAALGVLVSLLASCAMDERDQAMALEGVEQGIATGADAKDDVPASSENFQTEVTTAGYRFDLCGWPPFCPEGSRPMATTCDAACYVYYGYDCFWGYNRVQCITVDPTGTISASPTTVSVPTGGIGTTRICWDVNDVSTGEVWVSMNGASESLFARDPNGCQDAPWIQANNSYTFSLYAGTAHSAQLASVTVTGIPGGTPPPGPSVCDSCRPGYSCHCGPLAGCIRNTNQCQ
jgi:hypothetical protein